MRYLGIDLGDRRTGLAVGDDQTRVAVPAGVIEVPIRAEGGEALVRAVAEAARRLLGEEGEVVVGLALNMDGSEGARARVARAFGARVGERTGRRVHYYDERLTSVEADWRLSGSGLTRGQKKARRDAVAAAAMLGGFLEGLGPTRR